MKKKSKSHRKSIDEENWLTRRVDWWGKLIDNEVKLKPDIQNDFNFFEGKGGLKPLSKF